MKVTKKKKSVEEKIRDDIIKKYGKDYEIDVNITITQKNKPPTVDELAKDETSIIYLGKRRNRFVYLLKRGAVYIGILLTLTGKLETASNIVKYYIPKTYDYATELVIDYLRPKRDPTPLYTHGDHGYLILSDSWLKSKKQYVDDLKSFDKLDFETATVPPSGLILASGSTPAIRNGTTSLENLKSVDNT